MYRKAVSAVFLTLLLASMLATSLAIRLVMAQGEEDGTVYDYTIVSVTKTGPDEITVKLQVRYCPACNPNDASNPGCKEFTHGYPPPYYPYQYWCGGMIDGRYIAVRMKDETGAILGTQKLVCNPTNWPLNIILTRDFVFSGVLLVAGSTATAEADVYCSWCGHWYPTPVSSKIAPLKVCIDPGHDYYVNPEGKRTHIGATGYDGETLEVDVNFDTSLRVRDLLESKGIEVVMTREAEVCPGRDLNGDDEISATECLQSRCDIANTNDCNIFVSIHCNSWKDPYVAGTITFYYDHPKIPNPEIGQPGYGLAYNIQTELVKQLSKVYVPRDIGVKGDLEYLGYHLYVLTNTKMPAALTEIAFISNPLECALLSDPSFRQTVAQGIANGILRYFEERGFTFVDQSPVDLIITDPDGLRTSKQFNEIPGATYREIDLDGDGDLDDQVRIPDIKIGDYLITVIPEPSALPTDTYTLEVLIFGFPMILAENIPISEIPAQPYKITSTETGVYVQVNPPTAPVGGEWVPIDKLQLLAPWITMASLMVAASLPLVYAKHKKKQQS